jgi:hypothetical protein
MNIGFKIFNKFSGRYLADWETDNYLVFSSFTTALQYIRRKNLNAKLFVVSRFEYDLP